MIRTYLSMQLTVGLFGSLGNEFSCVNCRSYAKSSESRVQTEETCFYFEVELNWNEKYSDVETSQLLHLCHLVSTDIRKGLK